MASAEESRSRKENTYFLLPAFFVANKTEKTAAAKQKNKIEKSAINLNPCHFNFMVHKQKMQIVVKIFKFEVNKQKC